MNSETGMKGDHWCLLFFCLLFGGCDIINPEEEIPARIHIEPFTFQVQPGQGSAQNKITEVWVFANNQFLGAFNPPVDVNYLESGLTSFSFRPGIRNNGIAEAAIVYPLFTHFNMDLDAQPGAEFDVQPITGYRSDAFFSLQSDFESGNDFIDNRDTVAASNLVRSSTDVFEGQFSGEIVLSEQAHYIEVSHAVPMSNLPTDGSPTYLEFRYKSEADMSVAIIGIQLDGNTFTQFFYVAKPSEDWNMLYLELTEWLTISQLPAYKIMFSSLYPSNATKPELRVFLDNIKVVHL